MAPIPRLREYSGPAILSYGFRPFFLVGALYSGLAILIWLAMFFGYGSIPTSFAPRDWHIHEMLYGYVAAIITGFLLTAIPNWTGRLPLQGGPLLLLVAAWLAGRVAVSTSAVIGSLTAAILDLLFLTLVALACLRELMAGRNWHNLVVLAAVMVLIAGNVTFHAEAMLTGAVDYGARIGIAAAIFLITIIGGRVIPSFTRNWLARENPGRLPVPFGRFDAIVIATGGIALIAWVGAPEHESTGGLLIAAASLHAFRVARWAGHRTLRDPLVTVLHIGYAFVPLGFVLVGAAAFDWVPQSAGIHAWTAGAIGTMTLAIMTRASLGHTGRPLMASAATRAIYIAIISSALVRICAAVEPQWSTPLLYVAGLAWAAAFLGFCITYGLILSRRLA